MAVCSGRYDWRLSDGCLRGGGRAVRCHDPLRRVACGAVADVVRRPLYNMEPADADAYFGTVLRDAARGIWPARSQELKTYFLFLGSGTRWRSAR